MGDIGITIRKLLDLLRQFKGAFETKENGKCVSLLSRMTLEMIHLPTFLNPGAQSPTRAEEIVLSRDILENGVLFCARTKDMEGLERYFNQVRVYYADFSQTEGGSPIPKSEREYLILGLNLMRLLVSALIAEFHMELELIPHSLHTNMYIKFPVQLERHLMEGSYNKLLRARPHCPSNEYLAVVEMLEETVRSEITRCIPVAYPSLSIGAAQSLLMVQSQQQVTEIGTANGWTMNPEGTAFVSSSAKEDAFVKRDLNFRQQLQEHIHYAAELQKVV